MTINAESNKCKTYGLQIERNDVKQLNLEDENISFILMLKGNSYQRLKQ